MSACTSVSIFLGPQLGPQADTNGYLQASDNMFPVCVAVTAIIVSGQLILGGSAVITALTGTAQSLAI